MCWCIFCCVSYVCALWKPVYIGKCCIYYHSVSVVVSAVVSVIPVAHWIAFTTDRHGGTMSKDWENLSAVVSDVLLWALCPLFFVTLYWLMRCLRRWINHLWDAAVTVKSCMLGCFCLRYSRSMIDTFSETSFIKMLTMVGVLQVPLTTFYLNPLI